MTNSNRNPFNSGKGYVIEYKNIEDLVDSNFVKSLRKKLKLTQTVFATILGVKKKTIEKWEQGSNPVKGGTARLLFLIDKYPDLLSEIYKFEVKFNDINDYIVKLSFNNVKSTQNMIFINEILPEEKEKIDISLVSKWDNNSLGGSNG